MLLFSQSRSPSILIFVWAFVLLLASPSLGKSSSSSPAQLFGQRKVQGFLQQEPIFDNDADWEGERSWRGEGEAEGKEKEGGQIVNGKYVVRDPFDEKFDRMVEESMERWHVPGLSVAVVHGDETFAKGYGYAVIPSVNATPDTLYYVGSTTKSFTAAAILLLIEDSHRPGSNLPLLSLTTPVSTLIRSEFVLPDAYATSKATLEDLLTHRTGMPRHDTSYGNATLRAYVENLRNLPLTADLRTTFQYCNLMYTTLAYILETLTSSTYAEFVRARLWTPLGMLHTHASLAAARASPSPHLLSTPYTWSNATGTHIPEPHLQSPVLTGAGNVISSVADYARYLRALLHRRPNPFAGPDGFATLRKASRVVVELRDDYAPWTGPAHYGLGWEQQNFRGLEVYSHNGAVTGYGAAMAYVPQAAWGVAVMANTEVVSNALAEQVVVGLLEGLVGVPEGERWDAVGAWEGVGRKALERRKRAREVLWPAAPERGREVPLGGPLERYAGAYRNGGYGVLRLRVERGHAASPVGNGTEERRHLHASVRDKVWEHELCLEHVSGEYFMAWADAPEDMPSMLFDYDMPAKAAFVVDVSGEVEYLLLAAEPKMEGEMIVFERVKE